MYKYIDQLKPWVQIRTKLGNDLWYPNILISIKDKNLVIPISKNHIKNTLLENDFIKVSFSMKRMEITYLCLVENIFFENTLKMSLKILKEEIWENIRSYKRVDVNFICKVISGNFVANSYMTDISLSGCKIVSSSQLEKDEKYTICVFSENEPDKEFLKLYGLIKRRCIINNKLEYGIHFFNNTDKEKEVISKIVNEVNNSIKKTISNLLKKHKKI